MINATHDKHAALFIQIIISLITANDMTNFISKKTNESGFNI